METAPAPIVREFTWIQERAPDGARRRGWRPLLIPRFDAGSAFHVAHDSLEHASPTDDSLEAEMRAMGATLYTRGEGDFWKLRYGGDPLVSIFSPERLTAAYGVGYDMLAFLSNDERELAAPTGPIPRTSRKAEEALAGITKVGGERPDTSENGGGEVKFKQPWKERFANALNWARIGYEEQKVRFSSLDPLERVGLFTGIEDAVQAVTQRVLYDLHKGDTLRVSIDPVAKHFDVAAMREGNVLRTVPQQRIRAATVSERNHPFFA